MQRLWLSDYRKNEFCVAWQLLTNSLALKSWFVDECQQTSCDSNIKTVFRSWLVSNISCCCSKVTKSVSSCSSLPYSLVDTFMFIFSFCNYLTFLLFTFHKMLKFYLFLFTSKLHQTSSLKNRAKYFTSHPWMFN